jgi:hypothetical protein
MTSIRQTVLNREVDPYTEFWSPNYEHTPYSDMTQTSTRLSTGDDESDGGEI